MTSVGPGDFLVRQQVVHGKGKEEGDGTWGLTALISLMSSAANAGTHAKR